MGEMFAIRQAALAVLLSYQAFASVSASFPSATCVNADCQSVGDTYGDKCNSFWYQNVDNCKTDSDQYNTDANGNPCTESDPADCAFNWRRCCQCAGRGGAGATGSDLYTSTPCGSGGGSGGSGSSGSTEVEATTCPEEHVPTRIVVISKVRGSLFDVEALKTAIYSTYYNKDDPDSTSTTIQRRLFGKNATEGGWCHNSWIDEIEWKPIAQGQQEEDIIFDIWNQTDWTYRNSANDGSLGGDSGDACEYQASGCKYYPGHTIIFVETMLGQSSWREILSGFPASTGSYGMTPPHNDSARQKIMDVANPNDSFDAAFGIIGQDMLCDPGIQRLHGTTAHDGTICGEAKLTCLDDNGASICGHTIVWLGDPNNKPLKDDYGSETYFDEYDLKNGTMAGSVSPYSELVLRPDAEDGEYQLASYICETLAQKHDIYGVVLYTPDAYNSNEYIESRQNYVSPGRERKDAFLDLITDAKNGCRDSLMMNTESGLTELPMYTMPDNPGSADQFEERLLEEVQEKVRYLLVKEPRINLIWCSSDIIALQVRAIVKGYFDSLNLNGVRDTIHIFGYGGSNEVLDLVTTSEISGTVDTETTNAEGGYLQSVSALVDHFVVTGSIDYLFDIKSGTNIVWYDSETRVRGMIFTNYNPFVSPTNTNIVVGVNVLSIPEVSSGSQSMTTYFIMTELWNDNRLGWTDKVTNKPMMQLDSCAEVYTPPFTVGNKNPTQDFWTVEDNCYLYGGTSGVGSVVMRSRKMKMTTSCPMDLANFPFDVQECTQQLQWSAGFITTETVPGNFPDTVPATTMGLKPGFENTKFEVEFSHQFVVADSSSFTSWDSGVNIDLKLERSANWFWFNVIIPQLLISQMGFFQFWLPPAAVPARAAVMLLSILNTMNARTSVGRMLPQNGDMSWLDIYMFANLSFLVIAAVTSVWSVDLNRRGVVQKGYMDKKIAASIWANLNQAKQRMKKERKILSLEQSGSIDRMLSTEDFLEKVSGKPSVEMTELKKVPETDVTRSGSSGPKRRFSVKNVTSKANKQLRGSMSMFAGSYGKNESDKHQYLRYVFRKYDTDQSNALDWGEIANAITDILPRGLIKIEDLELFVRDYTARFRSNHQGEINLTEDEWVEFMFDIKPVMHVVLLSLLFGDMSTNLADKIGRRVIVPVFFVVTLSLILYAVTR